MSLLYFRWGGLSRLSWCGSWISSGDILFMMTLGWVVRAVSIWAALGGGPVCILVIEFSFTEKLARIPGGGGSKVHGLTSGNGWTIFGGPVKGSTGVL